MGRREISPGNVLHYLPTGCSVLHMTNTATATRTTRLQGIARDILDAGQTFGATPDEIILTAYEIATEQGESPRDARAIRTYVRMLSR